MLNLISLATGCVSQQVYLIYWDVLVFFIIFPEKIWILLFHLEISALPRVALSPTSPQLWNIREIIYNPLKIDSGFCIMFSL